MAQTGYWTEGKIVNGTNVGGGRFVPTAQPAPAPTPKPAPLPAPSVTRSPSLYEKALSERTAATKTFEDQLDQSKIFAAQQRQARIDAINTAFAPRIAREEKAGEERMQRVKALTFKSGITGSGVDTTKLGEQSTLNRKALEDIEATKAMAIQEAFDKADALALSMAEKSYDRSLKTAEANVAEQKNKVDAAMEVVKSFGAAGVKSAQDLFNADRATYDNLKNTTGMTDTELDTYLKVNAPVGTYQWNQAKINGNKMVVPTIKNGVASIETIDMGFTPGKEIKTTVQTDDGVLLIYDDGTYKTIGAPKKGTEFGAISKSDQTDAENWVRTRPNFSESDIEKLKTDRTFQAYVLGEVSKEKASLVSPF